MAKGDSQEYCGGPIMPAKDITYPFDGNGNDRQEYHHYLAQNLTISLVCDTRKFYECFNIMCKHKFNVFVYVTSLSFIFVSYTFNIISLKV